MTDDIKFALQSSDFSPTERQLGQFDEMINFLTEYNQKVNLTAITARPDVIEKHIIDSLLPLKFFDIPPSSRCVDIGAGAGFPSVPLMIMRPDLKFTLVDSRRKRTDYLTRLCAELKLLPEEILNVRAEELNKIAAYKNAFGIATARAVGKLDLLLDYAVPFLKRGGKFLAMRGGREEIPPSLDKALKNHDSKIFSETDYSLPNGDGRKLIIIEKQ